MAIFSKNANRAALFGKQKLFKACCTPEVEECCYLTNPVPRRPAPPCTGEECKKSFSFYYLVNNGNYGSTNPINIYTSELPAVIEVFIKNDLNYCSTKYGKLTSETPNPNINITTYNIGTLEPGDSKLAATLQLNTVLGEGMYYPTLSFTLCDEMNSNLNIAINIQEGIPKPKK